MKTNNVKGNNYPTTTTKAIKVSLLKDNLGIVKNEVLLTDILEGIKNGTYLARKQTTQAIRECTKKSDKDLLKRTLFGFTPSGNFNKVRSLENLVIHTGLINIDIDVKDNPDFFYDEQKIEAFSNDLKNLNSCISYWRTAGNGFSILFKINPNQHLNCFYSLKYMFYKKGIKADPNCKDITRLRNINFDAGIYINPALYNAIKYDAITDYEANPLDVQKCLELDAEQILKKHPKAIKRVYRQFDVPVDPTMVGKAIDLALVPQAVQMAINYCHKEGASFTTGKRLKYILKITALMNQLGIEPTAGYNELCKLIGLNDHIDHSYNFYYIYKRGISNFAKKPYNPSFQAPQAPLTAAKPQPLIHSQYRKVILPTNKKLSDVDLSIGTKTTVIISPTNSGKTFRLLKSGNKIDFLVPYVDLAKQIGSEYGQHVVFEGILPNEDNIQIGTYNAIDKLAVDKKRTQDRILVIDECHKLVADAAKTFRNKTVNSLLSAAKMYKQVIFLTGTYIENKHPFFKDAEFIEVLREEQATKNFKIVEYKNKFESVEKRLKRNKLNIVFLNSLKECKIMRSFLNGKGYSTQLFNSTTKEDSDHYDILTQQCIKESVEVLITTSLFVEGLNIYNTNISTLHAVSQVSEFELEQLVNRTRNKTADQIYIYTSKISNVPKDFNLLLDQENLIQKASKGISSLEPLKEFSGVSDLEAMLKANYQYLSGIGDCIRVENNPEGRHYEVDYLSIAFRSLKSKVYANYRYMQMFVNDLAKFGFVFNGIEIETNESADVKASIAMAKDDAKNQTDFRLKMVSDTFLVNGEAYLSAIDISKEKDKIKADFAYKTTRIMEFLSYEDSVELVNRIKLDDKKFQKVIRQLKNMKINYLLQKGNLPVNSKSDEYNFYLDMAKGFKVGERLTSQQIKERLENVFKPYKLLNISEVTLTKSTQTLSEFYGMKKAKVPNEEGLRVDGYEIISNQPLDVELVNRKTFEMSDLDFTDLFNSLSTGSSY